MIRRASPSKFMLFFETLRCERRLKWTVMALYIDTNDLDAPLGGMRHVPRCERRNEEEGEGNCELKPYKYSRKQSPKDKHIAVNKKNLARSTDRSDL